MGGSCIFPWRPSVIVQHRPFTGPGGPFAGCTATGQPLQYNTSRQNAFFEFKANKLTLEVFMAASPSGPVPVTVSNDEWQFDVNKLTGGDPTMHNTTHALDLLSWLCIARTWRPVRVFRRGEPIRK